jgi:hypothetical protein
VEVVIAGLSGNGEGRGKSLGWGWLVLIWRAVGWRQVARWWQGNSVVSRGGSGLRMGVGWIGWSGPCQVLGLGGGWVCSLGDRHRTIEPREVQVVPTKEAAVSCGELPRAICADRILRILQHFDHGASLVPLGGVVSGSILD